MWLWPRGLLSLVQRRVRRRLAIGALWIAAAACSSRDVAGPTSSARDEQPQLASQPAREGQAGARPRHALVVGGTGMLSQVSLELARRGYTTSVIARRREPLERLAQESGGRIHPMALDYGHADQLASELEEAVRAHGPIELVVAWIHSNAPEAPLAVARTAAGGHAVDYFHVLGSAADDPSQPDESRRAGFEAISGLVYHEVILGFAIEDGSSRWLTDEEISTGVLAAIDRREPRWIVGTTRPWSARP